MFRRCAAALALLTGFVAFAHAECPLRMVEPRLEELAVAARGRPEGLLAGARFTDDAALRGLAIVAEWYAARSVADEERRTRATLALLEHWHAHRPAARLLREVGPTLAAEGWLVPPQEALVRRLSQLGDRDAVLARARAVADAPGVDAGVLAEALRGVTVMAVVQDPVALALAGRLLERLDEPLAAAETRLYRAEQGDGDALAALAAAYRDVGGRACEARAALVETLFARP